MPGTLNTAAAEEYDSARCCHQHQEGFGLEHKTFALAINRDYFSTVFTSDHPYTI